MAIIATGVGSGLDIEGLVSKLMEAERAPTAQRLMRKEMQITSDVSALGTLKSAASDLQQSLSDINALTTYTQTKASSSDVASVVGTSSANAATGSYSVSVSALAASQSLAVRHQFSSLLEEVGTGTLTFTVGTTGYTADQANNSNDAYTSFTPKAGAASKSITIDSSNNTLQGLRDAINAADLGLTAAIVSEGDSYRLLFSSDSSGVENSFQVSVTDTGDSNNTDANGLSRLAFNASAGTGNVYQTVAGANATFSVNGLALTSDSNNPTGVIEGVDLTLKAVTTAPVTITVRDNSLGIKAAINQFVSSFNSFTTTVNGLTGYDATTGEAGPLLGDFTARSMTSRLRTTLGSAADGWAGTNTRLAELGVAFNAKGMLEVDDTKLSAALSSGVEGVAGVLTRFAQGSSGSGLTVNSFSNSVPKGDYAVAVSSLATSGRISATVPAVSFPVTLDGTKDELTITVDGTASGTITLASQAYASLADLATELQTKVNADAALRAAGKSISIDVSGETVTVRSNTLGSTSSIAVANVGADTTVAALGLIGAVTTNGTDLVGTINGVSGVATGNVLTGAAGTDAAGLVINVGSTSGGTVTLSDGVVSQLDTLLDTFLGTDNPLDSRISALNARATGIASERLTMERRLEFIEARYRRQFNALDALLNQVSSTGSFVTQQLSNIPIPGQSKK